MATPRQRTNVGLRQQSAAYSMDEIPRFVLHTSPVGTMHNGVPQATALPLNLLALIVSYLDDIGDIARVTRTSRMLYYMTLPQLYQKMHLHSYPEMRYVNGRPEGYGSGSPFMMALNGLATKEHVKLVRELRIWGAWRESDVEQFSQGRVPDNSMMLNILLRTCLDRMCKLEVFRWDLDSKPLKTLYQGLASHETLTSLTLRFPSSRISRPSTVVPPIPNLRIFKAYDIDPLCYPDDLSVMFLHSRKLKDIRLHFSPRMRREAEPTVTLETYFGRCVAAGYKIQVRHFGLQNFFGRNFGALEAVVDTVTCKSVCFLDTFGGALGEPKNKYIDDTWSMVGEYLTDFRYRRHNELSPVDVNIISKSKGMERLYLVSARTSTPNNTPTPNGGSGMDTVLPSPTPSVERHALSALGKDYIYALTRSHGSTLKHLLLSDQWDLTTEDLGDIIRYCPNLEQMGLALQLNSTGVFKLLMPFLTKLTSIRILENEWLSEFRRTQGQQAMIEGMQYDLLRMGGTKITYIGVGDRTYLVTDREVSLSRGDGTDTGREVIEVPREMVANVDIWKMDSLDLDVEPAGGGHP